MYEAIFVVTLLLVGVLSLLGIVAAIRNSRPFRNGVLTRGVVGEVEMREFGEGSYYSVTVAFDDSSGTRRYVERRVGDHRFQTGEWVDVSYRDDDPESARLILGWRSYNPVVWLLRILYALVPVLAFATAFAYLAWR